MKTKVSNQIGDKNADSLKPSNIIEFLDGLDPHSTYPNKAIVDDLLWVGIDAGQWGTHAIRVGDTLVWESNPDIGPSGIWPVHLVGTLFPMLTGGKLTNNKYGRGAWYADALEQLKTRINPQDQ
jgi:hypothetical protein